ncbi:MAG: 2OG-Fe(II) oxygenase [Thiotrichaceae bacterium]|nr:2OG-Fe(II) oxygenase [Thiotrichaceae bacterium]
MVKEEAEQLPDELKNIMRYEVNLGSWKSDWNAWIQKYIASGIRSKEFDLMLEELDPDIYHFPLFTAAFCEEIIIVAKHTADWTVKRHDFYPTNDVLLVDLGLADMYQKVLEEFCHPIAREKWRLEGDCWMNMMDESFMARYRAEDQQSLNIHHDFSDYTFTIGLNTNFEGGGTWFVRQQVLGNPKNGYCTLFPCITHPHGGRPTTKGTRYIIVSFCRRANVFK